MTHAPCPAPTRRLRRLLRAPLSALAARDTLPPDVRDDEITVVALFRLSLWLNRATGGPGDMTFSARSFRGEVSHPHRAARWGWRLLRLTIDLACALMRGEAHHCEVAWRNHAARGRS